jgi:hypothetical protein
MLLKDDEEEKRKSERFQSKFNIYAPLCVLVFGVGYATIRDRMYPYRHPQIIAEPYVAPEGCEVKKYKSSELISEDCIEIKYIFRDKLKYGLPTPGGWTITKKENGDRKECGVYYRVGNDLIAITCGRGNNYANTIIENVFIVK